MSIIPQIRPRPRKDWGPQSTRQPIILHGFAPLSLVPARRQKSVNLLATIVGHIDKQHAVSGTNSKRARWPWYESGVQGIPNPWWACHSGVHNFRFAFGSVISEDSSFAILFVGQFSVEGEFVVVVVRTLE